MYLNTAVAHSGCDVTYIDAYTRKRSVQTCLSVTCLTLGFLTLLNRHPLTRNTVFYRQGWKIVRQFGQVNVLSIWNFNLDIVGYIIAQLRAKAEYLGIRMANTIIPLKKRSNITNCITSEGFIISRPGVSRSDGDGGCLDSCCYSISQLLQLHLVEDLAVTIRPRWLSVVHVGR